MQRCGVLSAMAFAAILTGCSTRSANDRMSTNPESVRHVLESVRRADLLILFEGLPHPLYEHSHLAEEMKLKEPVTLHDHPFYKSAIEPSPEAQTTLRELLGNVASFEPFHGPKACGGFHPDWCVE